MATLKAFNASARHGTELHARAVAFCRDSVRLVAVVIIYVGVVAFMVGVGTAAAVGIGAVRLTQGELDVGALLIILLLAREAFRPLNDLERAYHGSYAARPACTSIFELLDAQPEAAEPIAPATALSGSGPPRLQFADVTFAYQERFTPALEHFSLDVAPGERVALVGRSGAGKTTAVSLLLRFFDSYHGRITLADRDIRDLPLTDLRAMVAVVSQDTYLLHGTVRRNLQLARAGATEEELVAAARAASAHDFITALPESYDTVIGERGLKLSGGRAAPERAPEQPGVAAAGRQGGARPPDGDRARRHRRAAGSRAAGGADRRGGADYLGESGPGTAAGRRGRRRRHLRAGDRGHQGRRPAEPGHRRIRPRPAHPHRTRTGDRPGAAAPGWAGAGPRAVP